MNSNTVTKAEETYVLRVTAQNKAQAIPFYGSYMTGSAKGALVCHIKEVTPFELFAKGNLFGCMINSSDMVAPVRVEIAKKESDDEYIVAGEGTANLAHVETNGAAYIYSK